MKLHKFLLASALTATFAAALSSCTEDPEMPPMVTPEAPDIDLVNTTLLDLKTAYWASDRNYVKEIGLTENGEHIYVRGRVVSSDASGNIYKTVVLADSTAALAMAINGYDLFETYQFGQELVIDMTGLKIGGYNGLMQLGGEGEYNGAPSMTFMESELFASHAQQNGLANSSMVDTLLVTIPQVMDYKADQAGLIGWQSQLVRVDGVKFEDAGQAYAPDGNSNRYVVDEAGNRLLVRCSSYASFAKEIIPSGIGSVVGILSYYGSDWQMLMIDGDSAIGFDDASDPGNPDEPGTAEGNGSEEKPYTVADVLALGSPGSTAWVKGYIVGSAAGKSADSFTTATGAEASGTNVFIATTPDETDYTKCLPVQLPAGSVRDAVNLQANPGNLGKELSVNGSLEKYFGMAGIKTVTAFKLDGEGSGEEPVTPPAGDPVTSLKVDFEGITAFSQLPGWTTVQAQGSKNWRVYNYTQGNNTYAQVTNYNGGSEAAADEAWLITPALNVDGMARKVFSFESSAAYQGNDVIEVFVLSSADPKTATLTKLDAHIATSVADGGTSAGGTSPYSVYEPSGELSLAGFSGVVYVGFRYTAPAGTNFHTYCVDNIVAE